MKRINKVLLSLLCLVIAYAGYSQIIPTYSVDSVTIQNLLPNVDEDTLVLINIDNTIITPKSKLFRYQDNAYINFTKYLYSLAANNASVNKTIAKLIVQRQMMLVESQWVDLINKMKNQGATVLGLQEITAPCNLIENYERWLYTILYGLNINFTRKVNDKEVFRFNPSDAEAPIFYLGIIFTGNINKVNTLIEFLKIIPIPPKKIVIFANNKKDLENMDSYLSMVDIGYYGIEYFGWQMLPGSPDNQIAELQQSTFLNTGQWLEDDTAAKMLNK
ncbi:DUF2608 domain-containing protein [Rickettsia prowazekii]|uniref:Uncharacterized protein RP296 n=2 Tax=Rickettsia prowazekii TaxID=782 RepID=Y296_RICPR|nr:DUF2608 domain-containing protein [Rickettsia prowazekii]Q9ZDN1.1 RecName: Full=Uncharacterized protein RP296; Flags: Precursor [Rickettsia prowazekii str. Madrid E]EOB09652.1 hypothetical protein H376_5970 [Rickettsia prowazekii str. GvF12]ADE29810.1 hypothetical protein rpr22_CDS290 [Rickettsia prowazekii str. Rp22]AFE49113.1 hypothetical protein M9W_01440 [Rickettsia prowazekii str. Chernikova]AFE49959.1 hypothetical protein M9Y_01445 [Rickettsia prowazekii str. Katsinyian]AFE50803.1 hy